MAQASEVFGLGTEEATATVGITLAASGADVTLTGAIGPHEVPMGEHHRLVGDVTMGGDMVVHGLLSCDPDVQVDWQGYQLEVHGSGHAGDGRLQLVGTPKTAWTRTGVTAPDWAATDQVVDLAPEKINLTRSVTFRNISRIMMHHGVGPQEIRWITLEDCGVFGTLGMYPIHFHHNADTTRGSIVEGVVVKRSQNRAFVPHGSHGITFKDCIAFNIQREGYWWDSQHDVGGEANRSHDISYLDSVVAKATISRDDPLNGQSTGSGFHRFGGFWLGSGRGLLETRGCLAVDVAGGSDVSGFFWPERDHATWTFEDNAAHHCNQGIFTWQNDSLLHDISRFKGWANTKADIAHGAYSNLYHYIDVDVDKFTLFANSRPPENGRVQTIEGGRIGTLVISHRNADPGAQSIVRNVDLGQVRYRESGGLNKPSHIRYANCGITPTDFNMADVMPDSVAEIVEGGAVIHRWANGTWN